MTNEEMKKMIQNEKIKSIERKGFSIGKCGSIGHTREEYNSIIVGLQNQNPHLKDLIAGLFPYA